jgi:hypothetical protein
MLSSNLVKGGALLDDTRRFVEVWDDGARVDANLDRIITENLLGHRSRKRSADVVKYGLKRRVIDGAPGCIPALRALLAQPVGFREACYYETARAEGLLASFAEGPLFGWYQQGRLGVTTADVEPWLRRLSAVGELPEWSEQVTSRAAQGLLSALRDFGVLTGAKRAQRKEFASPTLTAAGFAYVAFREREQGASGRALVESTIWRRWLLDDRWVHDLFTQADRLGVLHYARAGSAVRIDWRINDLAEVVRVAA